MEEVGVTTLNSSRIKHQYPTCWRSRHKIVWLARREYFYMIEKLGDEATRGCTKGRIFLRISKK